MRLIPLSLVLAIMFAASAHAGTVVELFTSKYCPSCPAAEHFLAKKAAENPDLLIVMQNVDYWDAPPERVDPFGNGDFTQRQYDYSNLLAKRPGAVFTPQPILNGAVVAEPPLFLNWGGSVGKVAGEAPAALSMTKTSGGGLLVSLPAGLAVDATRELTLISMQKDEKTGLWRGLNVLTSTKKGDTLAFSAAQVPQGGTHVLAMLQMAGPGKVLGVGVLEK